METGRENVFNKNLLEASEVKRSGFATKIHASPYKGEIDKWILDYRWSSGQIKKELHRKYPSYNHPSKPAIDNYRKRYLLDEVKSGRVQNTETVNALSKSLIDSFNIGYEAIKLFRTNDKVVGKWLEVMDKTGIPPSGLNDSLKTAATTLDIVVTKLQETGHMPVVPKSLKVENTNTNINVNENEENGKSSAKVAELLDLFRRAKSSRKDRESRPDTTGEGGVQEGDASGGHVSNDGGNPEVQEQLPPEGLV